jgi:hypothetical protein
VLREGVLEHLMCAKGTKEHEAIVATDAAPRKIHTALLLTGAEPRRSPRRGPRRTALTAEQTQANLREQAEVLVEAGVDFLLAESTGSMEHRKWVVQACLSTGVPTWIGVKCRVENDDPDAPRRVPRPTSRFDRVRPRRACENLSAVARSSTCSTRTSRPPWRRCPRAGEVVGTDWHLSREAGREDCRPTPRPIRRTERTSIARRGIP